MAREMSCAAIRRFSSIASDNGLRLSKIETGDNGIYAVIRRNDGYDEIKEIVADYRKALEYLCPELKAGTRGRGKSLQIYIEKTSAAGVSVSIHIGLEYFLKLMEKLNFADESVNEFFQGSCHLIELLKNRSAASNQGTGPGNNSGPANSPGWDWTLESLSADKDLAAMYFNLSYFDDADAEKRFPGIIAVLESYNMGLQKKI